MLFILNGEHVKIEFSFYYHSLNFKNYSEKLIYRRAHYLIDMKKEKNEIKFTSNDLLNKIIPLEYRKFKQQNPKIDNGNLWKLWNEPIFDIIRFKDDEIEGYFTNFNLLLKNSNFKEIVKNKLNIEINTPTDLNKLIKFINRNIIKKILNSNIKKDEINLFIKFIQDLFLKRLKIRSLNRESLLEKILESSYPIEPFPKKQNLLILAREWNSWYPSSFRVSGGCYLFNLNREIIIIDPGFNTLDILIKNNFDIRLIRHIFITHFHPDHFESLTGLLTRLTSKENKLKVYLNSTSFKQFQIYSKNFTEFIELKPNMLLKIVSDSEYEDFDVNLKVTKAYHKEIGGSMNSIGLKFKLKNKDCNYKIGFMSDTDGLIDYIEEYYNEYKDCNVIIPHLGAIHKEPIGNKHLYLTGVKNFLEKLKEKNYIIFLGEFGLELGSNEDFFKGISHFISDNLSYDILMKNIYTLLFPTEKDQFGGDEQLILDLFTSKFESFIKKINKSYLVKSLELLLPFLVITKENRNLNEDDFQVYVLNMIKKAIDKIIIKFEEDYFRNVFWTFLKKFLFQADLNNDYEKLLDEITEKWEISELKSNFETFTEKFFPYLTDEFKNSFFWTLLNSIPPLFKIHKNSKIDHFLHNIHLEINKTLDAFTPNIINFLGIENNLKSYLKDTQNDNIFAWRAFTIIFYIFLIIQIKNSQKKSKKEILLDGREIISKYFDNISNLKVFPVHSSFQIIFSEKGTRIKGMCKHRHETEIAIDNFNRNWKFISQEGKNEFINVIPKELCNECRYEDYSNPPPQDYPEDMIEAFEIEEARRKESEKRKCEILILLTLDIKDLFNIFNNNDNEGLDYIHSNIICNQIKKIKKTTTFSDEELVLVLLHPKIIIHSEISTFVEENIKNLTDDNIINVLNNIFSNNLPYDDELENLDRNIYLNLLDRDRISKSLLSKISKNIDLNFILKFINYFNDKLTIEKDLKRIKNLVVFKIFKQKFIQIFYPLIESPEEHREIYRELKNSKFDYRVLQQFGYPFNNYARFLSLNMHR